MAMSSTSQKHRSFVSEPMDGKSVKEIAGIGEVLGNRLTLQGYDKAYTLLGQFCLRKKERKFKKWLKKACNANAKQQDDCYKCLKQWTEAFAF